MKKRILGIVTALALCLSLLPATALATTGSITYLDEDGVEQTYTGEYTAVEDYAGANAVTWGTAGATTWYVVNSNVTINGLVTVSGDVHLILADGCTLTTGPIQNNSSLTIYAQSTDKDTMGKLTATGSLYRAAIENFASQNSITINGGNIQATGGNGGANEAGGAGIGGHGAIGSTAGYSGGTITINGGYIEATGGAGGANDFADYGGAGIGGGGGETSGGGGRITINGGTVIATGGTGAAGIGGGANGAGTSRIGDGTITITGGNVTANGGKYGAGIGGGKGGAGSCDDGSINITGGTVNATGANAAGIGGGYHANGGTINISDGADVTARGTGYGAGIGGGDASGSTTPIGGSGGNITISGGSVKASSTERGAGIGGGCDGAGGTINITGGTVKATPGAFAAGIGGGQSGAGGTINIGGTANVEATGGSYAAGIGGGCDGSGETINITGGTVIATGGGRGAGIGGGTNGNSGIITISGTANVEATGGADYVCGAGIGGGSYGVGGTINITGGTVTATGATGDYGSAGIGGGTDGSSGAITISGGTVTATGKGGSAGIGGGNGSYNKDGGAAETITISGGTVTATGNNGAAGIGGGKGYSDSYADGDKGTFTTDANGNAIIKASSIADQTNKASWSGVIFEGSNGGVYGTQTLSNTFTVGSSENLLIAKNATLNGALTNNGKVYVDGTLNASVSGNVYYRLTLTGCTADGSSDYNGKTYAMSGSSVRLNIGSAPAGKVFDSWTITGADAGEGSFTMPSNAVTATANFVDEVQCTIAPATQTTPYGSSATLTASVHKYNNGSYSDSVTDGVTYQWYKGDAAIDGATNASYTTPTDLTIGDHSYVCKVTYNGNTFTSASATVTVGKAGSTVTNAPAAVGNLVYDGSAQELVTAGTATGGTMQYALSEDGIYSTDIPTGTNAGSYTVWYKVVGDDTHSDSTPASVTVTISKATPTGTPAYTTISTSGKTLADAALAVGSITPAGGSIAWDKAADTAVEANTAYSWTYTPADTDNYNTLTGSITPYVVSYSGGGSFTGGGSSTTTNPDGSSTTTTTDKTTGAVTETTTSKPVTDAAGNTTQTTTETVTNKDGSKTETVTETVKAADGSTAETKTETVTNTDGSKTETATETVKAADGSSTETKTEVKTDANGVTTSTETVKATDTTGTTVEKVTETNAAGETTTTVAAAVSDKAVTAAAESGAPVTLPVEVTATTSTETAPVVKVEVPATASEVKVEIPVETVTPGTVAVIVHADGTEKIVSTSKVTENGVALTLTGSTTVKVFDNAKNFNDVPASNVFYNEISSLSAREIMIGVSSEKFDLNGNVTLDQISNVAGRITGNVDVKNFQAGIDWGQTNGMKTGNTSATRGDVLKALYVVAGSPAVTDTSILTQFKDPIPEDLKTIAAWAAQNGILKGNIDSKGILTANLDINVNRGQACALAARTMNTLG